ncbi:MAG: DipZ protein [Solirubrobacterales bacterium]|nr:DipZ protein [Solirubrobacterales bacterium]
MTRAPVDTIAAPEFPPHLRWLNVKRLRMDRLLGRPVLIEFWDFCRPNSMRTLPYMRAWHERYGDAAGEPGRGGEPGDAARAARAARAAGATGLVLIGIHSPGWEVGRDREAVGAAVERLGIRHPVVIDSEMEMWREYENEGWPARYLFNQRGMLAHYHYGEGAYEETELAIQELLGVERAPLEAVRPEDAPGARLAPQSEDREGAYSGPYEAGGVWGVFEGAGWVQARGGGGRGGEWRRLELTVPGAQPLIEHERHTAATIEMRVGGGLHCLATCFTPGLE